MNFIKTTILGGFVFLVPFVILVAIIGKAFRVMMLVAKPMGTLIPIDYIGGIAVANLLALLAIVALCFGAGVIARSASAKKAYRAIDTALAAVPGYALVKGFMDSMSRSEEAAQNLVPVIVRLDDYSQIGFEVERTDGGRVVVYLPGAPNPWSGSVGYFSENRVKRLDITVAQTFQHIRRLGHGAAQYGVLA